MLPDGSGQKKMAQTVVLGTKILAADLYNYEPLYKPAFNEALLELGAENTKAVRAELHSRFVEERHILPHFADRLLKLAKLSINYR